MDNFRKYFLQRKKLLLWHLDNGRSYIALSTWTRRYCTHFGTRSFSLTGHRIIEKYETRESHGGQGYYLVLDTGSKCARKSERQPRTTKRQTYTDKTGSARRGQECWLASNWIPSIYHSPPLHLLGPLRSVDSLLRFGTANKNRVLGPSLPCPLSLPVLFNSRLFLRHRFCIRESNPQNDWSEFLGETLVSSHQFADVHRYKLYMREKLLDLEGNYCLFMAVKLIN